MTEQATVPAPTAMPRQRWAHLDGVVDLRRNQPVLLPGHAREAAAGDWRFEHFVIGMDAYARGSA